MQRRRLVVRPAFVILFVLSAVSVPAASLSGDDALPTFGRPTIVGVQAGGNSEPGLRIDTHGRMYVTSPVWPYSAVWRSLDGGATFKWIPGTDAKTGRVRACRVRTGGDSEIATDSADRLYFSDRLSAEASPFNTAARSDDQGRTFRSSCNAVTSSSTDRPWYAVDGDPLAGGSIYLAIVIVGGDRSCEPGAEHDQLALARSPIPGQESEAGISFGPLTVATGPCAMGRFGNVEVSPVSHNVFVPHTIHGGKERGADALRLARCRPVPFSSSRPGGLECVDLPVATIPGFSVGDATLAVDRAGGLYVAWYEVGFDATGGSRLFLSTSRDDGETWTPPFPIETPGLRTNIWPWIAAGDPGRLDVAWYGTDGVDADPQTGCGAAADVESDWGVYFAQTLNGLDPQPEFSRPILVSEHFVHRGGIADFPGGKFCGNGVMGDFLQLRIGRAGEAVIVYADSNNANGIYRGLSEPNGGQLAHPMLVRQNGGAGAYESQPVVRGAPPATNRVSDAAGDATFEAGSRVRSSQRNLDILASSVSRLSSGSYRITITVADLRSLAPTRSIGNGDKVLVWLAQWLSPSRADPHGGQNLFAYMESQSGRAPTFWIGQSARSQLASGAPGFTYPGIRRVRGSYTRAAPGRITIVVPASGGTAPNPVSRTLYHVTASTMTLAGEANRPAPVRTGDALVGGTFFNVIDSAPSYDFVP